MAYKFVNAEQLDSNLTAVADAIRAKGGTSGSLEFPEGMVEAISSISTGAGLNFDIVGNPQPTNPAYNTIWVDTDVEITGWDFSAAEPANPAEGMVWFSTGTESTVAFNALKENSVMVYPISAKQYSGGAWVSMTAKSYRNGAWEDWFVWNGQLYQNGNEFTNETGGWYATGSASLDESDNAVVTRNANSIRLSFISGGRKTIELKTRKPIDLTNFNLVTFDGYIHPGTGAASGKEANGYLYVYKIDSGSLSSAARVSIPNKGVSETVTIDVSGLSGEHYIAPNMYGYDSVNPYLEMEKLLLS